MMLRQNNPAGFTVSKTKSHGQETVHNMREYGSFKDSRRSPVHRWFAYPAGYSHRLVEAKIQQYGLGSESVLVDPFLGSGTTTLAASCAGVNSVGVEAHPFVSWVAKTKCTQWDAKKLAKEYDRLIKSIGTYAPNIDNFPELIYKCFTDTTLRTLTQIHQAVDSVDVGHDFFRLALTATLRHASTAGTGWPYIAPSKYAEKTPKMDALQSFVNQCDIMLEDVSDVNVKIPAKIHTGDSRRLSKYVKTDADLIVTSPPYLNNYDYADRTRFETYFLRIYEDWADITKHVRDNLMTAATTQIRVSRDSKKAEMSIIRSLSGAIHGDIMRAIDRMSVMRTIKPGKKRYDLMTGGYFEDLTRILMQMYDIMGQNSHAVMVLGDSAPYGVHVPTDVLIGRIAVAIGFKKYDVEMLRERGDKWRSNPQRHHVPLRESITTLTK